MQDDEDRGEIDLAGSLRLLSSSRSNISRVEPGQLLNLDDRETDVKLLWFKKELYQFLFSLGRTSPVLLLLAGRRFTLVHIGNHLSFNCWRWRWFFKAFIFVRCVFLYLVDSLLLSNDPLHLPLKVGHRTKCCRRLLLTSASPNLGSSRAPHL